MAQTVFDKPLNNDVNNALTSKVDKYQGTENAAKVLGINNSGNVTPVDVASARDFVGATTSGDGAHGLVPAPLAGDNKKVLTGDGTWQISPGARVYTKTITITNTSGAYNQTFEDVYISEDMKPIEIEVGNVTVFGSTITVTPNNGSVTIACSDVCGTETIKISFIKATDPATTVNSAEFEILDNKIKERVKTVNGIGVDANGNVPIHEVEVAHQIATDDAQSSEGTYLFRTTGGNASLSDGPAMLVSILGRSIHTGEVQEVVDMTVTEVLRQEGQDDIYVTLDKDIFKSYVTVSGTTTLTYDGTNATWGVDLTDYGIAIVGTPLDGDVIEIVYVKGDRGTITNSDPSKFTSTGWNLYNNDTGYKYARVKKYSDTYGFIIGGTYTKIEFSETLSGSKTEITPVSGYFNITSDGYIWVTGGDATTYIFMTWSDWTEGYAGTFQSYVEYTVDLSTVMNSFPDGLMQVGGISDEINVSMQKAISRIGKMAYDPTDQDVIDIIESGRAYDIDTDYIYYVKATEEVIDITLDGSFTASDHGLEIVDSSTSVAPMIQTLYGQNLVDKLRTDVLTKSVDLIDNLTTNDATKVLSAKQGKLLNDTLENKIKIVSQGSNGNITVDGSSYVDRQITVIPSGYTPISLAFTAVTGGNNIIMTLVKSGSSWYARFKNAGTGQIIFNCTMQITCIK